MSLSKIPESVIKSMNSAVRAGDTQSMLSALSAYPGLLHIKAPLSNDLSWLHIAALSGKPESVKVLLDAGLSVDIVDGSEQTPLRKAAVSLAADVVQLLLARGADPNGRGGSPPLHGAVIRSFSGDESRCRPTLEVILRANPDIEMFDNSGCTPLMAASKENNFVGVTVFLTAGADVFAHHQRDGRTALEIASSRKFMRIVGFLESYMLAARAQEAVGGIIEGDALSLMPL